MRVLKASLIYFVSVFAVGFLLGAIRVTFLVPRLGVRWAELLELPLMLAASFFFARLVVRRFGPFSRVQRLDIGWLALVFIIAAELSFAMAVLGQTWDQYLAGRDPVSSAAYALSLIAFSLMPLFAGAKRQEAPPSNRGT